ETIPPPAWITPPSDHSRRKGTTMLATEVDEYVEVEAEISVIEERLSRLQEQYDDAQRQLRELRNALIEGECGADDVVSAESRVNVLGGAIAQLNEKLQPLKTSLSAEMARREADRESQNRLDESVRLARVALGHADA